MRSLDPSEDDHHDVVRVVVSAPPPAGGRKAVLHLKSKFHMCTYKHDLN